MLAAYQLLSHSKYLGTYWYLGTWTFKTWYSQIDPGSMDVSRNASWRRSPQMSLWLVGTVPCICAATCRHPFRQGIYHGYLFFSRRQTASFVSCSILCIVSPKPKDIAIQTSPATRTARPRSPEALEPSFPPPALQSIPERLPRPILLTFANP